MGAPVHPAPGPRPTLEVADIVRADARAFRATHRLSAQQDRVLRAIAHCRTAALGGFTAQCDTCGEQTISYRSCRNRHCPKCQTLAKQRWVESQCADLLDVDHWHLVLTLPHALNPLALSNPGLVYDLLFGAASQTLLEFGRNPRWLGGELGITVVLHTWGQNLGLHIHVHCVVTGGALSEDGQRWLPAKRSFLFPTAALSTVFRGKYLDALARAYRRGAVQCQGAARLLAHPDAFQCLLTQLRDHDWVVYAKPPFAGAARALAYLGRYTHRIAIANHRLVGFDGERVRFRWRDYARGNQVKVMTLPAEEFLRRFLLHTLPHRFVRIRHYGILGNRCRHQKLAVCRALLDQPQPEAQPPETPEAVVLRLTGVDITRCPHCGRGRLRTVAMLQPVSSTPDPRATGPP